MSCLICATATQAASYSRQRASLVWVCRRLWSQAEHAHRPPQELPEIKRLDLAEVVLTLKAAGVQNLRAFRWFEPPEEQALTHAEELLTDLGALKPANQQTNPGCQLSLTLIGRKMLAFPLHPRYARMLLAAQQYGCVYQACLLAALTQGRDLLLRNVDGNAARRREDLVDEKKAGGDFSLLTRAWQYASDNNFQIDACRSLGVHAVAARQVGPLWQQFLETARREGLDTTQREAPEEALRKCILIGFSDRVARRLDSGTLRCDLVHGRRGTLARESVAQSSPLLVAAEVREVEGKDKSVQTVLSLATAIEETWLHELFPEDITAVPRVFYDADTRRVYAEEQLRFRDLAIGARRVEPPAADAAARLLAAEVLAGRLTLNDWDESLEQWILRLNLLSRWCPELALPPIGDEDRRHLIEQVCHGSFGGKELKDKPAKAIVRSWLSGAQQEYLEKHAPERLSLSNGRTAKVLYEPGNPPHIALRIQQLYGVKATPHIAMGRVPLLVHILAPSQRPVQITQDLPGFWREHYPRIKQELQRKYPRHEWR